MAVNLEEVRARHERLGMTSAPKGTFPFRMPHELPRTETPPTEGPQEALGSSLVDETIRQVVNRLLLRVSQLETTQADLVERTKWFGKLPKEPVPVARNTRVSAELVIKSVREYYLISQEDLFSERRTKSLMQPRHCFYYLMGTNTHWSLPRIGKLMNQRDHTTVRTGKLKAQQRIDDGDQEFIKEVTEIRILMGIDPRDATPCHSQTLPTRLVKTFPKE